jgi:hypothetical protein
VTPSTPLGGRSMQSESYKDAVAARRAFEVDITTPYERERAAWFNAQPRDPVHGPPRFAVPVPGRSPCTGCGRHAFPVPTVCYWCRHRVST